MKLTSKMMSLSMLATFMALNSPTPAHAHMEGGNGLVDGVTHALFGADHLLAIIAIVIMSTQIHGKIDWKILTTAQRLKYAGAGIGAMGIFFLF